MTTYEVGEASEHDFSFRSINDLGNLQALKIFCNCKLVVISTWA
jgi:hypothetical protein